MLRLLATALLLAGLMLGQSGHGSFGDTGHAANGSAVAAMHNQSAAHGQGEGHRGAPSHGCHYSPCPQTFLTKASSLPVRATARAGARPVASDRIARSILLERDPPIPRSLL